MDETVLRDQINDTVLLGDLHGNREIVRRLWGEVNIDGLLGERWVWGGVINFHNVQLLNKVLVDTQTLNGGRMNTFAPVAVRTEKVKSLVVFW